MNQPVPLNQIQPTDATVLVIDDEASLLRYFEYNVRRAGYAVRLGKSIADLFRLLEEEPVSVLLLDLMLPDGESLDVLPQVLENYPSVSVVMVTAHGTIPRAVEAIRIGAINFIQKPVSPEQLETVLHQGLELWRLKEENRSLRRRLEPVSEFHGMVGESEPMQEVYSLIESVAGTSASVMITGESGTGKELAAQAIHKLSPRSKRPFIAINCAAIPRELLESEIFGHEKGAFTGATDLHRGCFERADGGTLFLDEICEMDINLQAKLLRLLQEQQFYRIGGSNLIRVNVRILAATNRDPLDMVEIGKFREDLYYRLNVLPIELPPLRRRREDISLLVHRFLIDSATKNNKSFEGIEKEAVAALEAHPWVGNIRELQNVVEQITVLNNATLIKFSMLPEKIRKSASAIIAGGSEFSIEAGAAERSVAKVEDTPESLRPFWKIERDTIQHALDICRGNVQEAARRLEISSATLYRKIEKYGLTK